MEALAALTAAARDGGLDDRAAWRDASGGAAADQPDGRGDQEHRQCEQPAALDPLEWPEPAGRLVAGPLCVAVPRDALGDGLLRRLSERPRWKGRAEAVEEAVGGRGEGELAALGPPLAEDPRGTGRVRAAGDQRRQVVPAQEP